MVLALVSVKLFFGSDFSLSLDSNAKIIAFFLFRFKECNAFVTNIIKEVKDNVIIYLKTYI